MVGGDVVKAETKIIISLKGILIKFMKEMYQKAMPNVGVKKKIYDLQDDKKKKFNIGSFLTNL